MTCDDARTALVLAASHPDAAAHVAACATCGADATTLAAIAHAFAADPEPATDPARVAHALAAASPILAARRAPAVDWWRVAAAVLVALLPLPLVVAADWWLLQTAYGVLSTLLPSSLSLLVLGHYAAFLLLLLTLTYAAVPVLAARPLRDHHA